MTTSEPLPELKKTAELNHPYSLCGRRCYMVGFQNGLFPDIGWHKSNEMGGVWTHPIKIADGFWISIETTDEEEALGYNPIRRHWLQKTNEFVIGDGGAWVEHRYDLARFGVVRHEFIPREEPAVGVEIRVTAKDEAIKKVQLNVLVRFDILSSWQSGWPDPTHLETEVRADRTVVAHGVSPWDIPYDHARWAAALRSDPLPDRIALGENLWGPDKTFGNGTSCILKFPLELDPDARVRFVLAGDYKGQAGAIDCATRVLESFDDLAQEKIDYYTRIGTELTTVDTPEPLLNDAFLWCKMNLEWMTHTSPCVGTCTVAGHQDYTSYFGGDTFVSIRGMLSAGLHQTAKDALRVIAGFGDRAGGKIPHEFSTTGLVHDPGSAGETCCFQPAVWDTYLWTGDEQFLREMYPICRRGMLEYIPSEPTEDGIVLVEYEDHPGGLRGRMCPSGFVSAYRAVANMADRLGDTEAAQKSRAEAARYKKQLEELFWVEEEGFYVSSLDGNNKPVIRDETEYWIEMHMIFEGVACNMTGDPARVVRALKRFEDPKYHTRYGLYLHWSRDENMPITTGRAAIAEFNYGRQEQGLEFIRMIARTVGHCMPGATPEVLDPEGDLSVFRHYVSPHWNYLQLWSAAHVNEGLLWGVLRLEPDAARQKVTMTPRLPEGWPYAEFRNITIGESRVNVKVDEKGTTVTHVDGPKLDIRIQE